MSNNRETRFQGFAKALWDEIGKMQDSFCEESGTGLSSLAQDMDKAQEFDRDIQKLIARRAYDLVEHTSLCIDEKDMDMLGFDEAVDRIPDMPELPKESE
jgi:hypothetical protein